MNQLKTMGTDEMTALLNGKLVGFSASASVMVVTANEKFDNAYDYEGPCVSGTAGAAHTKVFKLWSDSCEVYGVGASTSWSLPYYSRSNSLYRLLYTNGFSREERRQREEEKIKEQMKGG